MVMRHDGALPPHHQVLTTRLSCRAVERGSMETVLNTSDRWCRCLSLWRGGTYDEVLTNGDVSAPEPFMAC